MIRKKGIRFIKGIKKLKNIILNLIIFIISLVIPKNDNIWLFGSWFGRNFSDNTKYLYLYCNSHKETLGLEKVIWVTDEDKVFNELKQKNLLVYKKKSIIGMWYHLRAGYHFICQVPDDINAFFSVNTKRIQLWHGVGFKNIANIDKKPNVDRLNYKVVRYLKLISTPGFWNKYTFLSTGEFATENIFNLSFRLWENKVIEGNYPRNLYLNYIDENNKEYLDAKQVEIIQDIKRKKGEGKNIVLYLPTYRKVAQVGKKGGIEYPLNILADIEFNKFINFLENNNLFFISKLHFAGSNSTLSENDLFLNLPADLDIYPVLKEVDVLITDYSSIYADFLFLDKPIIFYPYDLEEYKFKDKGFLLDYNEVTPGGKVFSLESLKLQLLSTLKSDVYKEERERVKELYFGENIEDNFNLLIKKIRGE